MELSIQKWVEIQIRAIDRIIPSYMLIGYKDIMMFWQVYIGTVKFH